MNTLIREKRKLFFGNKRITPQIIYDLARIIEHERKQVIHEKSLSLYSLDASDNSSYESQSIEIFKTDGITSKKEVFKISMKFNTESYSKSIEVQFIHALKENNESYISVSGDDNVWVNGVLAKFSEILELAEKQPKLVGFIGYLFFGMALLSLTLFFKILFNTPSIRGSGIVGGIVFFGGLIGIPLLIGAAYNRVMPLWPSIELQTGYQYNQVPERSRRKATFIITMVVIPIILAIIYDVLKNWLNLF